MGNGVGVGVSSGVQDRPYTGMSVTASNVSGGIFRSGSAGSPASPPPPPGQVEGHPSFTRDEPPLRIQAINIDGLPQSARDELASRLPVHEIGRASCRERV